MFYVNGFVVVVLLIYEKYREMRNIMSNMKRKRKRLSWRKRRSKRLSRRKRRNKVRNNLTKKKMYHKQRYL